MAEKKKTSKARKKNWYRIVAPQSFNEEFLGETLSYESDSLKGKTLKVNLMALSNDIKKQNINIKFKIKDVHGEKAVTDIIGYEMIPASVRRVMGKGKKKIDFTFIAQTKDKVKVIIKPLLIIRTSTKSSTASLLRKEVIRVLSSNLSGMTYDDLLKDIIGHKLQYSLKDSLRKIYPLRVCEIRELALDTSDKPHVEVKLKEQKEDSDENAEEVSDAKGEDEQASESKEEQPVEDSNQDEEPEEGLGQTDEPKEVVSKEEPKASA